MRQQRTIVTGSASGMGAATVARLRASGQDVVGVDLHGAEIEADLGTPEGRRQVLAAVEGGGGVDRAATFAGVSGFGGRAGSTVVSIDYFGTVEVLEGLRPLLADGGGAAMAVSSNAATTAPGISAELVEACLDGDEPRARALADDIGGPGAYAAAKLAIARWVRRQAPMPEWAGAGISLNAIAPGHVETALTQEMLEEPDARRVIERTPLPIGQPAQPEEIAALAALLLSDEGRFIVGSVVFIDGGTDAYFRADDFPTARERRS
jgi:NAD(P)-dependent dehydrogenase (short-subunit alcohol dehydrogenase family)